MRINTYNLTNTQPDYDYLDGMLHNDPSALDDYLDKEARKITRARTDNYTRSYEKAQCLQRLAERSRKARDRRLDD